MPVLEGLFPDKAHDNAVLDILFTLADWHALAKLRLHTDSTLDCLRHTTTNLGKRLRSFVNNICPQYDTKELEREVAARARRRKRKSQGKGKARAQTTTKAAAPGGAQTKLLNLITYKFHSLGDYVRSIQTFGTVDSYSTQTVSPSRKYLTQLSFTNFRCVQGELEHRRVKKYYARTNKVRFIRQIVRLESRERALERRRRQMQQLDDRQAAKRQKTKKRRNASTVALEESEILGETPPDVHHHISHSRNFPVPIYRWLHEDGSDIAMKVGTAHSIIQVPIC